MATARFPAATGWLAASVAGFTLVALATRAGPVRGRTSPARPRGTPSRALSSPLPLKDNCPPTTGTVQPRHCQPSGHGFAFPFYLLAGLALAALLVGLIALVVLFGPRLSDWRWRSLPRRHGRRLAEPAPDDLARRVSDTFGATLAGLSGGHIRNTVILCWHRLEQTADAAGLRRSPADTSSDLAERLLASLPVSEEPLHRLAALYRVARFSSHPIPDAAVDQARADLAQVRSELLDAARARQPADTGASRG